MTTVKIDGEYHLLCMEYHRSGCDQPALYPPYNRCQEHLPMNRSLLHIGGVLAPDGDDGRCTDCGSEAQTRLAYTESREDGRSIYVCPQCALRLPPQNFDGVVIDD